jgi:hypothetical protein
MLNGVLQAALRYIRHVFRRSVLALAVVVAGCGSTEADYKNEPRPPSPINVTASINADRVSVSPKRFGAGPIVVTVSNQTNSSQTVTFETDELAGEDGGIRAKTNAIGPSHTAVLQVDVRKGSYALATRDESIRAASIEVGTSRRSAQNDLLEP